MASATHIPNNPDLEGAVNDAARCCSIASTVMEDALRPTDLVPGMAGYKTFLLTDQQWEDLSFIVGEAAYRSRKACDAFYAATGRAA